MPLLDTRKDKDLIGTFIADIVLQLLSFVAQNERENIKAVNDKALKRLNCVELNLEYLLKKVPDDFSNMVELWKKGEITKSDVISMCNISESTIYRRVRAYC